MKICVDFGHNLKCDVGNGQDDDAHIAESKATREVATLVLLQLREWGHDVFYSLTNGDISILDDLSHTTKVAQKQESFRVRAKNANEGDADLFVSIHFNGMPVPSASEIANKKDGGTEIYVNDNTSSEYYKKYENGSLIKNKYDVKMAKKIANNILKYIANPHYTLGPSTYTGKRHTLGAPLIGHAFTDRGVKDGNISTADFAVLGLTKMPSILVECCDSNIANDVGLFKDKEPYINHETISLLEGESYTNQNLFGTQFMAYSIARGIQDFADEYFTENTLSGYSEYLKRDFLCYTKEDGMVLNTINQKYIVPRGTLLSFTGLLARHEDLVLQLYREYFLFVGGVDGMWNYGYTPSCWSIPKDTKEFLMDFLTDKLLPDYHNNIEDGKVENLGALGVKTSFDGKPSYEFIVRHDAEVYLDTGEYFGNVRAGDTVGIYGLLMTNGVGNRVVDEDGNREVRNIYANRYKSDKYTRQHHVKGTVGPVITAPTRPSWVRINYYTHGDKTVRVTDVHDGKPFGYLATNLNTCKSMDTFTLKLNYKK